MKWDDLVHLMLYNLTVYHSKKYYDLDSVILPYINDNWHALQLPATVSTNLFYLQNCIFLHVFYFDKEVNNKIWFNWSLSKNNF